MRSRDLRRAGARLLNRTNRSVTLSATGEELQATLAGPFAAIGEAIALDVPGAISMNNTAVALDLIRQGAALARAIKA